jgi:hypothetical protein
MNGFPSPAAGVNLKSAPAAVGSVELPGELATQTLFPERSSVIIGTSKSIRIVNSPFCAVKVNGLPVPGLVRLAAFGVPMKETTTDP